MTKLIIALFIALVAVASAFPDIYGDCGDLSAMRSDFVKESFDITKTTGMYYYYYYN